MSAHLHPRLRLLLWVLLAFGVDQGVALAQELRHEGKTGHAWVRHSGTRQAPGRVLPDLPYGPAALPAVALELPALDTWARVPVAVPARETTPRSAALPSAYPRGPPA
ncbi:MAG: hypothetical protein AB1941_24785 [Gemmatimonadota bacterium]